MRVVDYATMKGDGKTNQDRYLIGDYYAAVLDGASGYPPQPEGRDGGWYAEQLAQSIERLITPALDLEELLARAIEAVVSAHDLVPGESPSSTVALVRWNDSDVECLVLGDSSIVVSHVNGEAEQIIDDRLAAVATAERRTYRRRLAEGHGYDQEHRLLLAQMQREQRRRRNVRDGYWIAEAVPEAAHHAIQARYRLDEVAGGALVTDGVSVVVESMKMPSWKQATSKMRREGCGPFLSELEAVEAADPDGVTFPRSKCHDDKSAVLLAHS